MTCREIEELAPLYLSGELDEARRAVFHTHLQSCRDCRDEMDQQAALDARLRETVADLPDATAVERAVRRRIALERSARYAAIAAAVLVAVVLGYRAFRPQPVARLYADAALDHRLEVMEHQPRHWRTDPAEIEKLATRFRLPDVRWLAPGYRLERAKICGIDGAPALHLVYSNGSQEVSVFVRQRDGTALRAVAVGTEHLAAFELGLGGAEAVIATSGSREECDAFARRAQEALRKSPPQTPPASI